MHLGHPVQTDHLVVPELALDHVGLHGHVLPRRLERRRGGQMLAGFGLHKGLDGLGMLGQESHPGLGLGLDAALHDLVVLGPLQLGPVGLAGWLLGSGLPGLVRGLGKAGERTAIGRGAIGIEGSVNVLPALDDVVVVALDGISVDVNQRRLLLPRGTTGRSRRSIGSEVDGSRCGRNRGGGSSGGGGSSSRGFNVACQINGGRSRRQTARQRGRGSRGGPRLPGGGDRRRVGKHGSESRRGTRQDLANRPLQPLGRTVGARGGLQLVDVGLLLGFEGIERTFFAAGVHG